MLLRLRLWFGDECRSRWSYRSSRERVRGCRRSKARGILLPAMSTRGLVLVIAIDDVRFEEPDRWHDWRVAGPQSLRLGWPWKRDRASGRGAGPSSLTPDPPIHLA